MRENGSHEGCVGAATENIGRLYGYPVGVILDPILGFEVFIGVRDSLMDRKNCTPPKLHGTVSIWF
jgi:hypothetical protein